MNERLLRGAMGLAFAVTFITVGLGIFAEPHTGVVNYIAEWGISPYFMAWAFIISGVANGYDGLKSRIMNPAAFAVFILYTGFAWHASIRDPHIPYAPAAFYTLLCVVYMLNQWADRAEENEYYGRNN